MAAEPRPAGSPRAAVARRRRIAALVIVAGLATLGAGGWAATYSSLFRADHVTVLGTQRLSVARILRRARIGAATNVVHFDAGAAERRLERDPWIAGARVTRRLPGSITITIAERTPVARWLDPVTHHWKTVTDGGTLAPGAVSAGLPKLIDPLGSPSLTGEEIQIGAVAAAGLPPQLRAGVASVSVDPAGHVLLRLRTGTPVAFGPPSQAGAKGAALQAVLEWASRTGSRLGSIDVRVPGAPTARLADGSPATPSV